MGVAMERVRARLEKVKENGNGITARCPAHPDKTPSLSVNPRTKGDPGVLVYCHTGGCSTADITAAMGLTMADLFDGKPKSEKRREVAHYDYVDANGEIRMQVVRYQPKDFRQRKPDGNGGWVYKLGDIELIPYRLPELLSTDDATIYVAEGEKDVDALVAAGHVATCGPMGAGKWSKVSAAARPLLEGRDVVIIADKDQAGIAHARDVAADIDGVARSIRVVQAAIGKDAADHLGAGKTVDELVALDLDDTDDDIENMPVAWVDAHVGEAFAEHLGTDWIHVTAWKKWMHWDGRRWETDDTEGVHEVARQWIIGLGVAVMKRPGSDGDLLRKIDSYKRAGPLEAVVKVARRIKAAAPDQFDRHPHLLNVGNGVVDLRTGQLDAHDQALMMTKIAGADYEPGARHADIDAVLACVTPETSDALKTMFGTAASGETGNDIVPVFDGPGGNGKTTVLLGAAAALGEYAAVVPTALVMQTGRDEHPHVYETLRGVRLAFIEETEEDGGLRLERVKMLTGGGTITARPMGGSYYQFEPTHTLVIATNHRPIVNSAEDAIWRRLALVPFPYRYTRRPTRPTDRPGDEGLRSRVKRGHAQRAAFLAWIVAGAVDAYERGGGTPTVEWSDEINDATDAWRMAEDPIGRFIDEIIQLGASQRALGSDIYQAWKTWCDVENRPPGQAKNFHRKFQAHDTVIAAHVEVIKPKNKTTYLGASLEKYFPKNGDLPGRDTRVRQPRSVLGKVPRENRPEVPNPRNPTPRETCEIHGLVDPGHDCDGIF